MNLTDTIERWQQEVGDIDTRHPDWKDIDTQLIESQYGYIKLGLLLEKIRNNCTWKYCIEKFDTFKAWCESRTRLTIWQANSYIQASRIAIYLSDAGYSVLPVNYSQAVALIPAFEGEIGYYEDRPQLERVWESVCQLPKITASAIDRIVHPDREPKESTKLPADIKAIAIEQAKKRGLSLDEYIKELVQQDAYQDVVDNSPPPVATAPDPELDRVIGSLDRKFRSNDIVKSIDKSVDMFDRLMDNLVGKYISRVAIE